MSKAWAGPIVTGLIALGVAVILAINFQPARDSKPTPTMPPSSPVSPIGQNLPEHPIGDPVLKNHIQVNAVWLAGVTMEGMSMPADVIHLEADIKSTEDNPNGFAKDEFVPYLKVVYTLLDASGSAIESGAMSPMIASDGLHYGASLAMPKPGTYKLTYRIDPPSAGGLGRHVGAGGVAAWWEPFDASFEWVVEPFPAPAPAKAS